MDCDCAEILGVRLEEPQHCRQFFVSKNTAGARVTTKPFTLLILSTDAQDCPACSRSLLISTSFDKLRRTHALARLLQNNQVRILVGFVMSGDKTVYAAAKWARTHLIVAERSAPTIYKLRYSFAQRWLSFSMLRLADRITVQMPDFIRDYPASLRDRIEVIPNPVPVARRPRSTGRTWGRRSI